MTVCGDPCPACSKTCQTDHDMTGLNHHFHRFTYDSKTQAGQNRVVTIEHRWVNGVTGGV